MNNTPPRSIALDLLRAVAVLLVLGRHSEPCPRGYPGGFVWFMDAWRQAGWVGVDLFFVLSGYLVSGLLFREARLKGEVSISRFLLRRGLKIYPAFVVFILVSALIRYVSRGELAWPKILAELFFVQNYLEGLWGHTWSLAVEEHFYLTLPALLLTLGLTRVSADSLLKRLVLTYVFVASACWLFRYGIDPAREFSFRVHVVPTHLRIDSLLLGVVLASFYHLRPDGWGQFIRKNYLWAIFSGAGVLLIPFFIDVEQSRWMTVSGFLVIAWGAGVLLMGAMQTAPKGKFAVALAFVGAHSYSIYLWHAALNWGRTFAEKASWQVPWIIDTFVYFTASISLGVAMAKLVEWPVLRFRDRWFPSRSLAPSSGRTATPMIEQSGDWSCRKLTAR